MIDGEFGRHVENPLIWEFLRDNCSEFAKDVKIFSEEILANVPAESKPFVISMGLTFYSTPIVSLVPDFPWEPIEEAIKNSVRGIFCIEDNERDLPLKAAPDIYNKSGGQTELIEQAILASFVSISTSAGATVGAILVGGIANLLGKYVALTIAAILDETVRGDLPPVFQIQPAPAADPKTSKLARKSNIE